MTYQFAQSRLQPLLFERFPGLAGKLPWLPLVIGPTPVERLGKLSRELGLEVWIKRDDVTSPVYGGNKPRKLEFLIGAAKRAGAGTLITVGGVGSNHCLATALFGRREGFKVVLELSPQPVDAKVRDSLLKHHAAGAEMILSPGFRSSLVRGQYLDPLTLAPAYYLAPGGSNPVGVLGFVEAGLELAMQIQAGETPLPRAILLAAGTCGTWAGLVLGLKLAGVESQVLAVRVTPRILANPAAALGLAKDALALLRLCDSSLPHLDLREEDFHLDSSQYGRGYGFATTEGEKARKLMAAEGIALELTYTGKALAGLVEAASSRGLKGPVLYWHTYSSADLSAMIRDKDYQDLPPAFHQFFTDLK